jgi:TatA/E family protein of Tat protein translocase
MIGSLGMPELLFILVLALLIFGPRKLPEIGRTMGKAMGEFRRATRDLKRTLDTEISAEEASRPANPAQVNPAPVVPAPVNPATVPATQPSSPALPTTQAPAPPESPGASDPTPAEGPSLEPE